MGQLLKTFLRVGVDGNRPGSGRNPIPGCRVGVDRATLALEKADPEGREPVPRISTGGPGDPNPFLTSQTSLEGCFPPCDLRVCHLLRFQQRPKALTSKTILEHGKRLAPLQHIIDPSYGLQVRVEDQGPLRWPPRLLLTPTGSTVPELTAPTRTSG